MKFGYARESIDEDNLDLQVDALERYGVDEIFKESTMSMKSNKNELSKLINKLRKKDVLVVYSLDRLGKSIKGLQELAEYFSKEDIDLVVIKDNIDTTTNVGRYFLYTMCVLGDMERSIIAEVTKVGIKSAKEKGSELGRPKKKEEEIQRILGWYYSKEYSVDEISEKTGWGVSTIYKYIREDKQKNASEL